MINRQELPSPTAQFLCKGPRLLINAPVLTTANRTLKEVGYTFVAYRRLTDPQDYPYLAGVYPRLGAADCPIPYDLADELRSLGNAKAVDTPSRDNDIHDFCRAHAAEIDWGILANLLLEDYLLLQPRLDCVAVRQRMIETSTEWRARERPSG